MINKDRIVPIQKCDFLSMIGNIMALNGTSFTALASDVEGNFASTATGAVGNILCNQPLKSFDFASGATSATVYFVADTFYKGFTVNGSAATMGSGSVEVDPDGVTLYKAVLGSGAVTVSAVTPAVA